MRSKYSCNSVQRSWPPADSTELGLAMNTALLFGAIKWLIYYWNIKTEYRKLVSEEKEKKRKKKIWASRRIMSQDLVHPGSVMVWRCCRNLETGFIKMVIERLKKTRKSGDMKSPKPLFILVWPWWWRWCVEMLQEHKNLIQRTVREKKKISTWCISSPFSSESWLGNGCSSLSLSSSFSASWWFAVGGGGKRKEGGGREDGREKCCYR